MEMFLLALTENLVEPLMAIEPQFYKDQQTSLTVKI